MKKLFSLIALVGVFAACQPETIETTFDPDPAQVTITASATEILTADDVTSKATFTADKGSVSGNVITLEGNKNITATTVTVTATYLGKKYSKSVSIRDIAAGGKADYTVNIIVGQVAPSPTGIKFETDSTYKETKVFTLATASHNGEYYHDHAGHTTGAGHSYSHNGATVNTWMLNNTEMLLLLSTEYTKTTGNLAIPFITGDVSEVEMAYIEAYRKTLEKPEFKEIPMRYGFKVSAWAYYNVMQTIEAEVSVISINKVYSDGSKDKVGFILLSEFSSDIVAYEFASNTHYVVGHGHGHSTHDEHGSSNAGGGIAYAD